MNGQHNKKEGILFRHLLQTDIDFWICNQTTGGARRYRSPSTEVT